MAPLQGSRLGEAETEGLQNGFAHFLSTVLFLDVFVGCGDSTHPPANLIFTEPIKSVLLCTLQ